MKKYTVKELAYLFQDNGRMEVIFEDEPDIFSYYENIYTIEEIIDSFGERMITWISLYADDGDQHLMIELEGKKNEL